MEKQRDYSFDYIKGMLIFLVVLGHCIPFLMKDSGVDGMDFWGDPLFVFIPHAIVRVHYRIFLFKQDLSVFAPACPNAI